ncbi:MAG: flavodoxin family protein [Syntrophobacteraceae bacterium]|jgi:multimeric flavodoxin WrbA|nr:flavodoxin family protein [Syntrophobacteraceae bacterium]
MKIIGIEGSPRKNGNTEKLVRSILQGAMDDGHEGKFCKLADMRISPCLGCIGCRETGDCVVKDDMTQIYEGIQAADAIVIGSPVYMWQVSAQTKMFLDRLVPFIKPDFSTRLQGEKRLLLGFTQGNPDPQSFKPYFDYLEKMLAFLHFRVAGTLVASGTMEKDDILRQIDVLDRAKEMGRSLMA